MTELWINLLVPFFCHHGASGTNFKYPVMSGNSIQLFGHLECLNPSIIDAMGHCSRIRKNVTEKRQTENGRTERAIREATLIVDGLPG